MNRTLPLLLAIGPFAGCGSTWTLDDGVLGGGNGDCATPSSMYRDADGDGFGDPRGFLGKACSPTSGAAANATDCDDNSAAVNPAADERCNGIDDDCDPLTGEDEAVDAPSWYLDADDDGYGDDGTSVVACDIPSSDRKSVV